MLVDSNLLHEHEQNAFSPTGEPMCVFGDPAYPLQVNLQAPYRNGILTPMMEPYNAESALPELLLSGCLAISLMISNFWI